MQDQPPFLEAYPVLRVGEALRALTRGAPHIMWRDRRDLPAGVAEISYAAGRLQARFSLEDRAYLHAVRGEMTFAVTWKGSRDDNKRPFASCPRCQRDVDVLVCNGAWLCARCHGLKNRSWFLAEPVRLTEQLAEVEGKIASELLAGRALEQAERDHDRLRERLGDHRLSASAPYLEVITREWVTPLNLVPPEL